MKRTVYPQVIIVRKLPTQALIVCGSQHNNILYRVSLHLQVSLPAQSCCVKQEAGLITLRMHHSDNRWHKYDSNTEASF